NILTDGELAHYTAIFDRDWAEERERWYLAPVHQMINCDALVSSPEVDGIIRHPKIIKPVRALMGEEVCFSEICIRHMAAYDSPEVHRSWHRDKPHWEEHRLRIGYLQAVVYLTDVDETTHCFSISPESANQEVLDVEGQLERGGIHDLHGAAGTAMLFNVSVLHTATVRKTEAERKSVQTYYGHPHREFLSNDSLVPASLWRDHPDAEVRSFYGVLNDKTREYYEKLPPEEHC
ncbi:MAG: phytanoyl-CoA dioxygenase family protein, partial [Candidatus Poribacteria bacterium]|nr:phytanoyl-CoA dioxygenase family protein [Candidatus Poribacteria bacterium]